MEQLKLNFGLTLTAQIPDGINGFLEEKTFNKVRICWTGKVGEEGGREIEKGYYRQR